MMAHLEILRRKKRIYQLIRKLEVCNLIAMQNLAMALRRVVERDEDSVVLINEIRKWLV